MATVLLAVHGPVAASGMEDDPIRGGKAPRSQMGLVGTPVPMEFDRLLREGGNALATAIGRKPPDRPMRADPGEPETRDRTASHLRIIPAMAVHGATSLQRRTIVGTAGRRGTEVRRHPAHPPATQRRAVGELPPQDRTQPQARVILLRSRIQASAVSVAVDLRRRDRTPPQAGIILVRSRIQGSAVSVVADLPRRDRTQLQARAILLRELLLVRVYRAEVRATLAETRDLREAGQQGAGGSAGSRAGFGGRNLCLPEAITESPPPEKPPPAAFLRPCASRRRHTGVLRSHQGRAASPPSVHVSSARAWRARRARRIAGALAGAAVADVVALGIAVFGASARIYQVGYIPGGYSAASASDFVHDSNSFLHFVAFLNSVGIIEPAYSASTAAFSVSQARATLGAKNAAETNGSKSAPGSPICAFGIEVNTSKAIILLP